MPFNPTPFGAPTMSPTRRELVQATRGRILEAAARLVRECGANGFSMEMAAGQFDIELRTDTVGIRRTEPQDAFNNYLVARRNRDAKLRISGGACISN